MNVTIPRRKGTVIELPGTAPLVRLTAGVGSAGQKTWNLRRPVTLIGSRRPAHIVLHDRDVSNAHCVIVNTGTEVLLKDLHTSKGTRQNKETVDLVILSDGDVITVGNTKVQIAIKSPEIENDDSGCGLEFTEPTKLPNPVTLRLEHTDRRWYVEEAVALIGRHKDAPIRLENENVSTRHAVLFRFADGPAIVDIGSRTGVSTNAEPCSVAGLRGGDRIGIGPYTLLVCLAGPIDPDLPKPLTGSSNGAVEESPHQTATAQLTAHPIPAGPPREKPGPGRQDRKPALSPGASDPSADPTTHRGHDGPIPSLGEIKSELATLQTSIADSWERLNTWHARLREDSDRLDKRDQDLADRAAELDAKDAALRGHLHDVTRYHEQVAERERELAAQAANIQETRDHLASAQAQLANRETEIARRTAELQRREHVLAQRWARLLAATCSHCGQPLHTGISGTADDPA